MGFRLALRSVVRAPGLAALIAVTMALGIGANTTMFGVARAVFLRPLPFPEPDRLVALWEADPARGITRQRVTPHNFVDWEAESRAFESMGIVPMGAGTISSFNVAGRASMQRVRGVYASSGFFRTVGVAPAMGRALSAEGDHRIGAREIVIGDTLWKDHFGGDANVLGKTLEVDTFRGGHFVVVGVMPPGFDFPSGSKMWLSLADWGGGPLPAIDAPQRCCSWFGAFARLRPGVTVEAAEAELTTIARRIGERHPDGSRVTNVEVVPLRESLVGSQRVALGALFGAVGCVLLVACANVANLLLSRGLSRRREVQTRIALGATRSRIAGQLLIESLCLCAPGGVAGVVIAAWAQPMLANALHPYVPLVEQTRMDAAVLAFALLASATSAVLCGLAPLAGLQRADAGSRSQTEGRASSRLRRALVVAEVALAVMLISSAGLLVRTLSNLQTVDTGFDRDRLLTVSLDVTTGPLRSRGNAARFLETLLPRVAALPGVRSAGAATNIPLESAVASQPITREDRVAEAASASPRVVPSAVTPGYFEALGVPLTRGRACAETDTAASVLIALINDTAARRYWPGEDPIGKRFAIGSRERFGFFRAPATPGTVEYREIVGVVGDVRSAGFAQDVQPEIFLCYKQYPIYEPTLMVRTAVDSAVLAPALRREIAATSGRAVILEVKTMDEVAARSLRDRRLRTAMVASFAVLALGLGMLGIYGVLSYTVGQRTREIGVRVALGADGRLVAQMIVGQAVRLTLTGLAIGLIGALIAARAIAGLLFGVQPFDLLTFAATGATMLGAAALAAALPARRAAGIEPAVALRSD
jgi:putative ABC transport system permease protein